MDNEVKFELLTAFTEKLTAALAPATELDKAEIELIVAKVVATKMQREVK